MQNSKKTNLESNTVEEKNLNELIGEKIKSVRILLGFTQGAFSKIMNITFQQVQKYEKGLNRISASALWELSRELGIDISHFFPSQQSKGKKGELVAEKKKKFNFDFETINSSDKDMKNTLNLIRDFNNISDELVKKKVLALIATMASNENKDEKK